MVEEHPSPLQCLLRMRPAGPGRGRRPGRSFAEIDGSWSGEQKVELAYMARISDDLQAEEGLTCRADLSWTSTAGENPEERAYTLSSEGAVQLTPTAPDLAVSLTDSPDPVAPGGTLRYSISYENQGGPASGAMVQAAWDPSLIFLSATPAPDQGTENAWTLGELAGNSSGSIEVALQAPADAAEGRVLSASARIAAATGPAAQAYATTTIEATPSRLFIDKSAAEDIIRPGGGLNYTISSATTARARLPM